MKFLHEYYGTNFSAYVITRFPVNRDHFNVPLSINRLFFQLYQSILISNISVFYACAELRIKN
jgi:hypothetical protein